MNPLNRSRRRWLAGLAVGCATVCITVPAGAQTAAKETRWDELIPKDWDPMKRFREANIGMLSDSNPKVQEMMREMRQAWDNAPTNSKMDGAAIRLPGYVVPLEEAKGELKEFLLVPYFGACVHSPPPPANQIVHVVAAQPMKGLRTMDPVWVSGTLKAQRQNSPMGMSAYEVQGAAVERYVVPAPPPAAPAKP